MKTYSRDKRSPKPLNEKTSRLMSRIRSLNTKPELSLRKILCREGLKGYRLNYKKLPGKPDIVYIGKKIAVFVNGCFWHGCPICKFKEPKNNSEFWKRKINNNKNRDIKKIADLQKMGYFVVTIWECELKKMDLKKIEEIKRHHVERKN